MNNENLNWLAGLLEGEGSFLAGAPSSPGQPIIRMVTTDRDVAEIAAVLMGVGVVCLGRKQGHHKNVYAVCKKGYGAVQLMMRLRGLMGQRRKSQIDKALKSFKAVGRRFSKEEIVDIRFKFNFIKMKQSEIAEIYGCSRETINSICNGRSYGDVSLTAEQKVVNL